MREAFFFPLCRSANSMMGQAMQVNGELSTAAQPSAPLSTTLRRF